MHARQLTLELQDASIQLLIDAPSGVGATDAYRDVRFVLPTKGMHRAVFFLLPDRKSANPFATKPTNEWDVPVRWDDKTMLFVPTLSDESILAALRYIVEHGFEDDALENEDDIQRSGG